MPPGSLEQSSIIETQRRNSQVVRLDINGTTLDRTNGYTAYSSHRPRISPSLTPGECEEEVPLKPHC